MAGFFLLLESIMGYFLGAAFILVAALKPFHPETAGLWVSQEATGDLVYSLHMGFGSDWVAGVKCWAGGSCPLDWWLAADWRLQPRRLHFGARECAAARSHCRPAGAD